MILNSAGGKGVGKKGNSVFYINHGVQIEREYVSEVSNPSTSSQVAQRSRFALASQISVAMADAIAIPRKQLQSPRNQFVKVNMPYIYGQSGGATVDYASLQLTRGTFDIPNIKVERHGTPAVLRCSLTDTCAGKLSRVVYNLFHKNADATLTLVQSVIAEANDNDPNFFALTDNIEGDVVVLAYGMVDTNEKATARYSSYNIAAGTTLANLIATRSLKESDYRMSRTVSAVMFDGSTESEDVPSGNYLLEVSAVGLGNVSVTVGAENPIVGTNLRIPVTKGATVSILATAVTQGNERGVFDAFYLEGMQMPYSELDTLPLRVNRNFALVAKFNTVVQGGGLE